MRVVRFSDFERFRKIPRSSHCIFENFKKATAQLPHACDDHEKEKIDLINVSELSGGDKLIFISHRWLRPWHTKEECEREGHEWAGKPHPDDAAGSKHRLICQGIRRLAVIKEWRVEQLCLWLDFCCVEQDDGDLLKAGVASLRGYISVCDVLLIPSLRVPDVLDEKTVDKIGGGYGKRAWTLLESMSFYTVRSTWATY
jgi:hypothetical protein